MVALGQPDEAIAALDEAMSCLDPRAQAGAWSACLGTLAVARWRRGDMEAARTNAQRAGASIHRALLTPLETIGAIGAAEAHLAVAESAPPGGSGTAAEARRSARQILTALRRSTFFTTSLHSRYHLLEGRRLYLEGATARAARSWTRSAAIARELQMPLDEALAAKALGRAEPPGSAARLQHLARAAALFAEMGCRLELLDIDELRSERS
jgi:hypothetical protein